MTKKIFIVFFLLVFTLARPAYAIFDVLAILETGLEYKQEFEHKVKEIQKFKDDQLKRLKQGFDMAKSCFKNPEKCASAEMVKYFDPKKNKTTYIKKVNKIFTMPGSTMGSGSITKTSQEKIATDIEKTYIYKRGRGDDLKMTKKNRDNLNKVIANETALMFAKGATTRHSIDGEDDATLYPDIGDKNNMDEILQGQARVTTLTNSRVARILELRASMISSQSAAELTQQSVANEEDE